jgi:hypothetical protein
VFGPLKRNEISWFIAVGGTNRERTIPVEAADLLFAPDGDATTTDPIGWFGHGGPDAS